MTSASHGAGPDGFRQVVARFVDEAARGEHHPMLHIECHGHNEHGLEFADGQMMPWGDRMETLRPLNEATELGLIVVVAACFGLGALAGVDVTRPAPCFALIGPSKGIWSNELHAALKDFYVDITGRTTTAEATARIRAVRLESGGFEVVSVRQWFRLLVLAYLDANLTMKMRKEQAMRQHRKAVSEGMSLGLKFWKRRYVKTLPTSLRGYHRRFFMVDEFPEHALHFSQSMKDIEDGLASRGLPQK